MKFRPLLRKLKKESLNRFRAMTLPVLVAGTAFASCYAAYAHALPYASDHSYFQLRAVHVWCDNKNASPEELAIRAGLYEGMTLWNVDLEAAERALEEIAWVREVHVVRRFPDEVSIRVFGRRAVATTSMTDGPYLIDIDGAVYRDAGPVGYRDLPYLTGWADVSERGGQVARLRVLMTILGASEERGYRISQIDVDDSGDYWLFPEMPRVAIKLGRAHDVRAAFASIEALVEEVEAGLDRVVEIDLSTRGRVVLKAADGGLQRLLEAMRGPRAKADGGAGERG